MRSLMLQHLLLSLTCLLAGWTQTGSAQKHVKEIPLRTHSLAPPYLDGDMQSRWFDFGGDTIVRADKYIRLAGELPSQTGWMFSKIPLTASNWEIEIEFKIHGKGNLHGDGMALWLTSERAHEGPVFGFKDNFNGLGIFFDTYKNNRPGVVFPYVMAMLGDGQTSYNKDNDGQDQEIGGCSARGLRNSQQKTRARITHYQDKSLTVQLSYKPTEEWTECFTTGPITIPSVTFLGFTAETGELSDNFDIISVNSKNLYDYSPDAAPQYRAGSGKGGPEADLGAVPKMPDSDDAAMAAKRAKERRRREGGGGFFKWAFRLIVLIFVLGVAYIGFTMYRANRRGSRFD